MRATTQISFDDAIVYTKVLDNNKLSVCDKSRNFSIIDLESQEKVHTFTFKKAYVQIDKASLTFSPDGRYLAFSETDQSVVRVIDLHKQKLHHSFPTGLNKIETLCFDPSSHYLIAGAITGRVFLWNLFSTGQVSRLSSFPEYSPALLTQPKINYVSYACFSPQGDKVATTGYGGSIVVTNIHTEVSPKRITPSHIRINALCFVNESLLCSGNIDGVIDIMDIAQPKILKQFQTGLGSVNGLVVSSSQRYLLASGRGKHISLIDLQTLKIIDADYIRVQSRITQLSITDNDVLIIACEDGSINFNPLFPEDKLQMYIDTSSYKKAYELLHKYPLLKTSVLIEELEDIWEEHLTDAINKVEIQRSSEVNRILKNFNNIPTKQTTINNFQGFISHFERFKTAVSHQNLALAYSMAEHIVLLKRTSTYLKMQERWNKAFLKAQTAVIKDDTHQLFKSLEPYAKVTSKLCFIQVLLHQPDKFLEFIKLISTHEYEKIFHIANKYPCLKEIDSFQNIVLTVEDLTNKCKQHIYSKDYELAELELKELSHIPYMKAELASLTHLYEHSIHFEERYENRYYRECYELIDKNSELQELFDAQSLEQIWKNKMKEAEKEALLGHTKEIKNILGDLIHLRSRAQKVGTLLRASYLTQIKLLVIKKRINLIAQAIHTYVKIFSYDSELHTLITKIKKEKIIEISLSPEQELRRPRSFWLTVTQGVIPDSILESK